MDTLCVLCCVQESYNSFQVYKILFKLTKNTNNKSTKLCFSTNTGRSICKRVKCAMFNCSRLKKTILLPLYMPYKGKISSCHWIVMSYLSSMLLVLIKRNKFVMCLKTGDRMYAFEIMHTLYMLSLY